PPPPSVFGLPDFRCMMVSIACSTLAGQALALVAGYQVFDITGKPLAIGILGLVEAIPAICLSLYGGHIADRYDRRRILITTLSPGWRPFKSRRNRRCSRDSTSRCGRALLAVSPTYSATKRCWDRCRSICSPCYSAVSWRCCRSLPKRSCLWTLFGSAFCVPPRTPALY